MRRQRVPPRAEPLRSNNADYPEADMREPHTNTSDGVMDDGFRVLRVQEGDRRKDFLV